jgi:Polyketide cyclase / dehydrase and lipid transport
MTSQIREFIVEAPAEKVWAAIGDFADGPMLTSPGFYSDCRLEGPDVRAMTFASNGVVVRERLVARDEERRRIVWAWIDDQVEHDNTSMQVFAEGDDRSRVVWIHDTLPGELASTVIGPGMDQSIPIIQKALGHPVNLQPK